MNQQPTPPIYLLGYMGSGKSTLGRELKRLTGMTFVDLDEMIERRYSMTIREMFATVGEAEFRRRESDTLHLTASMSDTIVALGGGTPCHGDNMNWMLANGTTVFLDASIDKLYNRLLRGRHKRPLIAELDDETLLSYIKQALKTRRKHYQRALHTFNADPLDHELERAETVRRFATQFGLKIIDNTNYNE